MSFAWVSISTHWGLTSVQAALNVFISVLGTIGIWAFSRYWWQRGCNDVLHGKPEVPLSSMFSLSGTGEGWDVINMLRARLFERENWRLLFQLLVVVVATLGCMFAGPIAKASLRDALTVRTQTVEVLQTSKGTSFIGNRLDANVDWNTTMESLDAAGYPVDRLMDYLPPSTVPWTYVASEWDPTWTAICTQYEETQLNNVTGTGRGTIYEPLDAFPLYKTTYDPRWLDTATYRTQADFNCEQVYTDNGLLVKDALFWILIQSDPQVNDRMYANNETLQISMSALHAHNFHVAVNDSDATQASLDTWRPLGPVENASYSRIECNITRKPVVPDENAIPWLWTNDTYSITFAYVTNWMTEVGEKSSKNLTVTAPSPQVLFRFYQAYMISVNTWLSLPSPRRISVWTDTIQMATAPLVVLVLLAVFELWIAVRYFWFLRHHKTELEDIPDGKVEWMVHAAKLSSPAVEEPPTDGRKTKDRDYFRSASFGNAADSGLQPPGLGGLTSRSSVSVRTRSERRDASRDTNLKKTASRSSSTAPPRTDVGAKQIPGTDADCGGAELKHIPSVTISLGHDGSSLCSQERPPRHFGHMLSPTLSNSSSPRRSQTSSTRESLSPAPSFRSIIPEAEDIRPIDVPLGAYENGRASRE